MPTSFHLFVNTINTVSRRWIHSIPYSLLNIIFYLRMQFVAHHHIGIEEILSKLQMRQLAILVSWLRIKKGYTTYSYISQKKFLCHTYNLNFSFTIFVIFEIRISCSLRILFFKSDFASNQDYGKWSFTHSQLMSTNTRDDKN